MLFITENGDELQANIVVPNNIEPITKAVSRESSLGKYMLDGILECSDMSTMSVEE